MIVGIEYGNNVLEVDVPAEKLVPLDRAPLGDAVADPAAAIRAAIESPDQYPPLRSALRRTITLPSSWTSDCRSFRSF